MKKINLLFLILILFLALGVRLYKINIPLADHHSWRQADTAAVARNFIKEDFDFFRPRIDNMTFLHTSYLPNPERLFLAEIPIYNSIVALFYYFFGIKESLARLVSILFSLGSIVFLFLLVKALLSEKEALWAAFFFAFLPFNIYYSRVILPEPLMVFAFLGMLFFFQNWLRNETRRDYILAILFTALALSQKIFPFFLALPMGYLVLTQWQSRVLVKKKLISLIIFGLLSLLPFIAWRFWITRFPEGIPYYDWLFNEGGIRFRPAFFRWIFNERIGKLILGSWGLPLLVLGLVLKPVKRLGWFFHWWLVAFLVYVTVFAAGNVTHDYYQVPFVPIAAVFLARGAYWLSLAPKRYFSRLTAIVLQVTCLVFMIGFSWYQVKDFYFIQGGVDLAGKAVDQLTPKHALILTGDSNDATLLYNCNRHGWTGGYASFFPNTKSSIEKVKSMGAEYYVTTKVSELEGSEFGQYLFDNYKVISRSDQYIVFDLSS